MALRKMSYREFQARVACQKQPRPEIDPESLRFGLTTDRPLTPSHPHTRFTRTRLTNAKRFAQLMDQYESSGVVQ